MQLQLLAPDCSTAAALQCNPSPRSGTICNVQTGECHQSIVLLWVTTCSNTLLSSHPRQCVCSAPSPTPGHLNTNIVITTSQHCSSHFTTAVQTDHRAVSRRPWCEEVLLLISEITLLLRFNLPAIRSQSPTQLINSCSCCEWLEAATTQHCLPATELNTDRQKTQLWDTDRYCTGDDIITSITPTIHYHYAANSLQQPISTAVSGGKKTRWVWKVSQSARLEHRTVTEWVGNRDGCGVRRGTTAWAVSMYRQNGETLESLLFYKTLTTDC